MKLMARLALADMRHDLALFGCAMLTVAAVLAPLLILLGLKTGVVEHLLATLRADPQTREITLRGHGRFPPEWFATMRARPDVAFAAPRLRPLSQPVDVGRPINPTHGSDADFLVSGAGDPTLGAAAAAIDDTHVVLSARLAAQGQWQPGEDILVWAVRRSSAGNRRVDVPANVAAIAPGTATGNAVVYGSAAVAQRLEAFQERPDGQPAEIPVAAGFRLFARDITDVASLESDLSAQGLEVRTEGARIAWVLTLQAGLATLFAVLTACAAGGCAVSVGAGLWGNVARKRRALSTLRLLGVPGRSLVLFPLLQAALIAAAGSLLGAGVALAVGGGINAAYSGAYLAGSQMCRITPAQIGIAIAASVVLALLAGAAAVPPILRIGPAEGMRET